MSRGAGIAQRAFDRVSRRPETPVVLCIDVEPDPRVFDRAEAPPWIGFERLAEQIPALRERLSEATGKPAGFTWALRMDPQVAESLGSPTWVADAYGERLAELTEAGDELALHTHVWRWDSDAGIWVNDFQDPTWVEHCLTLGLDAFETAFGRRCTVHRGGDHFLTGAMLPVLKARGVKLDLTVEPGLRPEHAVEGEVARGSPPDFRGVPHQPYRSSPDTFPSPDPTAGSDPLLIPLTSAARMRPPFRRVPLYLSDPPSGFGRRLASELIRKPHVLAFGIRSDAVLFPDFWSVVDENLAYLAHSREIAFQTASAPFGQHLASAC